MDANPTTLLIVDDEEEIREIISMHVMSLGLKVLEAGDGERALECLQQNHVDVVVSDLMMPRLSGLALLSAMRAHGLMQPFIFVTAYPSQETTVQALRLGAFDYIEKPFDGDDLRAHVTEALRVSKEMSRLGIKEDKATPAATKSPVDHATQQIQKLRTLRYAEDEGRRSGPSDQANEALRKLVELFIGEATAQLLFCQSSIRNLIDTEQRSMESGYLFRVMQGIADAATTLGATHVATLARAAEQFYTNVRVNPDLITTETLELASGCNETLQTLISTLGSPEQELIDVQTLVTKMDKVTNRFAKAS